MNLRAYCREVRWIEAIIPGCFSIHANNAVGEKLQLAESNCETEEQ